MLTRKSALVVAVLLAFVSVVAAGCAATTPVAAGPVQPAPATPPAAVRPVSVPLALDGSRLAATVEIGGTPLRVLVDTGSSGLRLAASKVPPGAAVVGGPAKPITFISGERLTGVTARSPLRIGSVSSAGPVPIELVTGSDCAPEHPDCAASDGRTPGFLGGRFDGIIGINTLSGDDVPNPLWFFGEVGHTYTVHADTAGSALVLGAPADGFALQPLRRTVSSTTGDAGPPSWDPHYQLCVVTGRLPGGRLCAPGGLDTGTPSLAAVSRPGGPDLSFPDDTPITFTTGDGRWSVDDVTGPTRSVSLAPTRTASSPGYIRLGLPALAGSDLRIDLAAGTIGLRKL